MNQNTKKVMAMAMLVAMSYVLAFISNMLPGIGLEFLQYDPKDITIIIGGFIYGPMAAFLISLVVSLLEFHTFSTTSVIGLFMNVLSSCSIACVAAFIYKKRHNRKWAVIGLVLGCITTTLVMILWNYLITPLYTGASREVVASMLVPIFLPFNLIKGALNSAATMLIYKPIVTALRKSNLIEESSGEKKNTSWGVIILSLLIIATGVALFLVFGGTI